MAQAPASPQAQRIIVSTGPIPQEHQVIGPIFAYGSSNDGLLKSANPIEAYQKVTALLQQTALGVGADGVIFTTFDYRVAANTGCAGGKSFEVFAYGTAVRLLNRPAEFAPTGIPAAGLMTNMGTVRGK